MVGVLEKQAKMVERVGKVEKKQRMVKDRVTIRKISCLMMKV